MRILLSSGVLVFAAGGAWAQQTTQPAIPQPKITINGEPEAAKQSTLTAEQKAEVDRLRAEMRSFYRQPDEARADAMIADMIRLGEFGAQNQSWPSAAFAAALMKRFPMKTETWSRLFDGAGELEKFWMFTAVWLAHTDEGGASLKERMELPEGAARRIDFPYLKQTPQDVLTKQTTGPTQIGMLWNYWGVTGDTVYLSKFLESFEDPPQDDPKMNARRLQVLQRVTESVKVELARASRTDDNVKAFLQDEATKRKGPVAIRIHETLKLAEGDAPIADAPPIRSK
jgi:hypothetical protein